jgi:hypothetical protein
MCRSKRKRTVFIESYFRSIISEGKANVTLLENFEFRHWKMPSISSIKKPSDYAVFVLDKASALGTEALALSP